MKKTIFLPLFLFLVVSVVFVVAQKKEEHRSGIKPEEMQITMLNSLVSLGFEVPSVGADPCSHPVKTMGSSGIKIKSATEMTGLKTKPDISVGRKGQIMSGEGEFDRDEAMQNYLDEWEAAYGDIVNNDHDSAVEHLDNARQTIEEVTRNDIDKVKNSKDPTLQDIRNLEEDMWCGGMSNMDEKLYHEAFKTWYDAAQRSSQVSQEKKDQLKIIFGRNWEKYPSPDQIPCDTPHCSEVKKIAEKMSGFLESYKKEKEAKAMKGAQIGGKGAELTKTGTKTVAHRGLDEGLNKEKEAKATKEKTASTPTDQKGRGSAAGRIDFCGRHLPTPAEAAAMGFDPGHITDPASEWRGRLEQRGTEKTLTWTTTAVNKKGETFEIEHTYRDGQLIQARYEIFDKSGNRLGSGIYDGKTKTITVQRLK